MGRSILGVVAGYVVMSLVVFLSLFGAYPAMGTERALQPGSYDPSALWLGVSFVFGFIAAVAGGCTCVWIAKKMAPAYALAGLVIVLGLAVAGAVMTAPPDARPTVRSGDVPTLEAMQSARTPLWVALVNPFLGAAGVVLGARAKRAPSAWDPPS